MVSTGTFGQGWQAEVPYPRKTRAIKDKRRTCIRHGCLKQPRLGRSLPEDLPQMPKRSGCGVLDADIGHQSQAN